MYKLFILCNVHVKMSQTRCHRQDVTDKLSLTQCHRHNVAAPIVCDSKILIKTFRDKSSKEHAMTITECLSDSASPYSAEVSNGSKKERTLSKKSQSVNAGSVTRYWNRKLPKLFQMLQKQFSIKEWSFLNSPSFAIYFGLLLKKNLLRRTLKIGQTVHTECRWKNLARLSYWRRCYQS